MSEHKIVVGVDTSEASKHALAWAMNEGELRDFPVVAVHQYHYPWAPAPAGFYPRPMTEQELAEDARKLLKATVSDVMKTEGWSHEPTEKLRFGADAADILCDEAADASLLVVGQRGGGGFLGLRLGSVSEGCLHHSPTTLIIVPEGSREIEPVKRVTVGVDGSERSRPALRWAIDEGERLGVPVVAVMAWNWLGPPLHEMQPVVGWDEDHASALLDDVLDEAGVGDLEREVVNGKAAKALIERSEAGDLVVVGAYGTSVARSVVAGSTSRQLAHHAVAPVAVVR